jgi:hypothetical protein
MEAQHLIAELCHKYDGSELFSGMWIQFKSKQQNLADGDWGHLKAGVPLVLW